MRNLRRAGKLAIGCMLLLLFVGSTSQQSFALSPIIRFYGYKLTTKNTVLELSFGVVGVLSSDQVHAEIRTSDLATRVNQVYQKYYQGPGNFTALVTNPPGQPGQPFKVGDTYYAAMYVYVPNHNGIPAVFEKDTLYTIQPQQAAIAA
ncbi:MAG TPA: hypothetical protein VK503_03165 [Candidatus Bathyarchaeia archaeon]|nr:hypothetical protein [Candidatus Bathyarchaeia archaeon]